MGQSIEVNAYEFIQSHDLAVIASVNKDGSPMAAAVYYLMDEDYNLLFLTKRNTNKARNIEHNARVAVVVYDEAKLTTAQGEGEAQEVLEPSAQVAIMNKLAKLRASDSKAWFPPIAQIEAGEYVIFKVRLARLKLSEFDKGQGVVADAVI